MTQGALWQPRRRSWAAAHVRWQPTYSLRVVGRRDRTRRCKALTRGRDLKGSSIGFEDANVGRQGADLRQYGPCCAVMPPPRGIALGNDPKPSNDSRATPTWTRQLEIGCCYNSLHDLGLLYVSTDNLPDAASLFAQGCCVGYWNGGLKFNLQGRSSVFTVSPVLDAVDREFFAVVKAELLEGRSVRTELADRYVRPAGPGRKRDAGRSKNPCGECDTMTHRIAW